MKVFEKIKTKDFALTVVGLGRVGLPLAIAFANTGIKRVYGIDINQSLIDNLSKGILPFEEENFEAQWQKCVRSRNFRAGTVAGDNIKESQVVIITVGTPLTWDMRPDLSFLTRALDNIAPFLPTGSILVIRSTVKPGTVEEIVIPHIREKTGKEIDVVVCPERIVEGKAFAELAELPEIVGGTNKDATDAIAELFHLLGSNKLIHNTDIRSAEMAKIFSNVYRYVTFALANEFAIMAEKNGRDIHKILKLANEGYKRGGVPIPGPAGGPCLYKDGHFLVEGVPYIDFIRTAWHLNESIPMYVVQTIKKEVGPLYKAKVGVLGLAYKAGSDDTRYSPAAKLVEHLKDEQAEVHVHDPHIPSTESLSEVMKCEIIILACNHREFMDLEIDAFKKAKLFYDCWGMFKARGPEFKKRNIRLQVLGISTDQL